MNNIELIEKELGEDIFPIALSSVRRLMMLARRDERKNVLKELETKGEVISTWMCPTCGKTFSKAWLKKKNRR